MSIFTALSSFPHSNLLSNLVKINETEFIAAEFVNGNKDHASGLHKYNTITDEWKLIFEYPWDFVSTNHRICYDKQRNIVYLCGGRQMVAFNLNHMGTKHIPIKKVFPHGCIGDDPAMLMINDDCHIILGGGNDAHYKRNSKSRKFTKIFQFPKYSINRPEIIYIKSQNKLLLFGGFDQIWECDINDQYAWTKVKDIKLPMEMCDFAPVMSKHEDYVILFGGENSFESRIKNIFILDLTFKKFYSSKLRLASDGDLTKAISMNNDNRDTALLSGFIRNVSGKYDINIPSELFPLFHSYFERDTIYLLEYRNLSKIELRDILQDKTEDLSIEWAYASSEDECE